MKIQPVQPAHGRVAALRQPLEDPSLRVDQQADEPLEDVRTRQHGRRVDVNLGLGPLDVLAVHPDVLCGIRNH